MTSEVSNSLRNTSGSDLTPANSFVLTKLKDVLGPRSVDGWVYLTDRAGFLAVRGMIKPEPPEGTGNWSATARNLLALSGKNEIQLEPLRSFARKCCANGGPGVVECVVFGCPLDARVLDKWLSVIPFQSAKVSGSRTDTVQKALGDCLVLEGENWKLVVSGIMNISRRHPEFPVRGAKAEGRQP